jgi:hypothetical protein
MQRRTSPHRPLCKGGASCPPIARDDLCETMELEKLKETQNG